MIQLYSLHPTSSFTVYPETQPIEYVGSRYVLDLTQDLDNSTSRIETLTRINTNTPNNKSQLIVLQAYSGSGIPENEGQYTAQLLFGSSVSSTWGEETRAFGSIQEKWSLVGEFSGSVIATDRAYVHGANLQTITTYTGTNQTGTYTTYNS